MKLLICAGPPTCGKTTVLRQVTKRLLAKQLKVSFLKIDVQYADEDEIFQKEFSIPARKVYSGELCPDHCTVMVLGDALQWAEQGAADLLIVETAGLCLRCSPYVEGLLGMVVLEATSGMNLPRFTALGSNLWCAGSSALRRWSLLCSCAAIHPSARAPSVSAKRRLAGNRTSGLSGRWKTRTSTAESDLWRTVFTSITPPQHRWITGSLLP